jgi:hypothetical protein
MRPWVDNLSESVESARASCEFSAKRAFLAAASQRNHHSSPEHFVGLHFIRV